LLRLGLWLADRLLWPMAALRRSLQLGNALDGVRGLALFRDCLMTGATPLEAHAWRSVHGTPHPLPARSAALLMLRLGDAAAHQLLADKLATAKVLAGVGVVFPTLHGHVRRGESVSLPAADMVKGGLFIKPRHGRGGQGSFALTRLENDWQIDQRQVSSSALLALLAQLSQRDDLLLQERLMAAADLTDLVADGRAPVLRLVTARFPNAAPFLHSALLSIAVPGRDPHHFLDGAIHTPVDLTHGRLAAGLTLAEPRKRVARLDWNALPLAGRTLCGFDKAAAMALRAMAAMPPLPVVHWDFIITSAGPVMLEGNSSGNWIIASLPGLYGLETCALAPLLARWLPTSSRSP
jgi:hypothetical protein